MSNGQDVFNVQRFLDAQDHGVYEQALSELRTGRKRSHWIWYVFPQVKGLGHSHNANYYGIGSWEELNAYVRNEVLKQRLIEASQALLACQSKNPVEILGSIDAVKVRSSMTLFELTETSSVFTHVLARLYRNERDELTQRIVAGWPRI